MRTCLLSVLAITTFGAADAHADPIADSCQFLDVIGQEKSAAVKPMFEDIASAWPVESRNNAIESVLAVIGELEFAGGGVYEVTRLGNDYADHIVALRLAGGELTAARLSYEYSPRGEMALTGMNFKRRMNEMIPVGTRLTLEAVECPSS